MTDDPYEIAYALLRGMCTSGIAIDTALLALRKAYETLSQVAPGALDGTCEHEECQQVREQLRKAAN